MLACWLDLLRHLVYYRKNGMDPHILQQKLGQLASLVKELQDLVAGNKGSGTVVLEMPVNEAPNGKVIEGIFNGQEMIGPDGSTYAVPSNYASKSKLVEGDALKLTITGNGSLVFKQIGPVTRDRFKGVLQYEETSRTYQVVAGEQYYRVLLASVTYYKGTPGDEVVILVPRGRKCTWAAIENIFKPSSSTSHVYPLPNI